jgi:sensor histidine kinase YesM
MEKSVTVNKWLRWGYGIVLGMVFNFLLDLILSLVYTNYSLFQPLSNYLISIVITYVVFEVLFKVNLLLNKKHTWDSHPFERLLVQFFGNAIIAIFLVMFIRWSLMFGLSDQYYISMQDELILAALISAITLIFGIIEMTVFLLNKWRFSLAELERFKKENAEFRFDLLRSQLNPHFLFNSLNTLSSLVYENPESAGLFIRELSDVYRYILENRDKELIALNDELRFVKAYIGLIKLRFADNIDVDIIAIQRPQDYQIMPLTLQLLLENAIKHNVVSKKNPLKVTICTTDDRLVVENNIQPKLTNEYSSGMGLKNIASRYGFLTNRAVTIENNGAVFSVSIPLLQENIKNLSS